ncbi:hypothetical protein HanXRQr2_Chr16g0746271 [Helianthus annuus]|uniref:Uncharacterized protein n=1 Tax=Helianthus annuus TaxID=4232 RepID=A0A9K3DSI7_HELAN|nr:hypothetical protein HanXRQr2_Chr16g0746271 [Helianthus annuus]
MFLLVDDNMRNSKSCTHRTLRVYGSIEQSKLVLNLLVLSREFYFMCIC